MVLQRHELGVRKYTTGALVLAFVMFWGVGGCVWCLTRLEKEAPGRGDYI